MSDSIDINIANKKVSSLLNQCRAVLCEDVICEVVHYIKHGEPEIAFEGLLIELMQVDELPQNVDKISCIELGKHLNLDSESVLKE
ncbi:hypothetical protein [Motiliproteus sp. MSK22-1]|uniref:hypothetical protein n=1 Tax=Motiliproteus sp. MSK22-1 TaxID=1897630 RepID=UPI0009784748|nr:hypothetical protein [Motiliproteus sp. MSK22-1]OMH38970.1 hypothetical protein BGP75_04385 [Motiliproteus sp. MSK22-1]